MSESIITQSMSAARNSFQSPIMPRIYLPPYGTPLNWHDEVSGVLPAAVMAFYKGVASDGELDLVIGYCQYMIEAPCWTWAAGNEMTADDMTGNDVTGDDVSENETINKLEQLREKAQALKTAEDVTRWIHDCMEIGIDPL